MDKIKRSLPLTDQEDSLLKYSRSQLEHNCSVIDLLALDTLDNLRFKEHPYLKLNVAITFHFGAVPVRPEYYIVLSYGQ